MDKNKIITKIIKFVAKNYLVEENEIPIDQSLIDTGIIDSIGLIELSTFMENNYNFTVEEEDMIRENFGSIEKMANFINRKSK